MYSIPTNYSSIPSQIAGNPALDAASSLSSDESMVETGSRTSSERLMLSRPRSTSNDTTDRGQHGYLKLKGAEGQNTAPTSKNEASSSIYEDSLTLLTSQEGFGYDKFLITSISSSIEEKVQITEVFGDSEVAYYFGRAPMMFTITGSLVDSPDSSWFVDWIYTYHDLLRGSKLAQNRELVSLVMPNMTLDGAMTNFSWEQNSQNDVLINFRFTMLVSSMVPTPALEINTAITNSANFVNFNSNDALKSKSEINKTRAAVAVLQSHISSISEKKDAITALQNSAKNTASITLGSLSGGSTDGGLFSAAKSGIQGFAKGIDGVASSITSGLNSILGPDSFLGGISTSLSTIRANLFLPVYGVMNSLSKLVGAVFGSNGISSLLSNLTAPIRNILGDITRFANQAVAIANMITNGISSLGRNIQSGFGVIQAYDQAAAAVSRASGTLAALPQSIGDSVQSLFSKGHIRSSAAFLKSNPRATLSRTPTLHFTHANITNLSPQLLILSKGIPTVRGAYL
jgi:hypothetical protein